MKQKRTLLFFVLMISILSGCSQEDLSTKDANIQDIMKQQALQTGMLYSTSAEDFFVGKELDFVRQIERGNISNIQNFVKRGLDPNVIGNEGMTPLIWAMIAQQLESFQVLLELGADPNIQAENGENPVTLAAQIPESAYLKSLLEHDSNINVVGPRGYTPLIFAVSNRKTENVRILIDGGANLNVQDDSEWTPLMHAISNNDVETARMLLKAGADTSIKIMNDATVYDMAKISAGKAMHTLLEDFRD